MGFKTSVTARSKAIARHSLDRALLPYFDRLRSDLTAAPPALVPGEAEAAAEPDPGFAVPTDFFHNTLHELRTLELEQVRKGARRALSVGASGRWYFDWFERHVGPVDEHIGVEAFEPMPDDLPGYATWIESTADKFDGVADGSVDLVFAGQTTEHLWADELVGFLLESRRVLSVDGQLIIDSPNRLVTEYLHWSHGGHTIEISATEMTELLELSGFDVVRCRGAWLCRFGGEVLQLEEGLDNPATVVRRIVLGADNPDDSFIWWIDAQRTDREPDVETLRKRIDQLFQQHWSTRVSRGMWPGPGFEGPRLAAGTTDVTIASLPLMLHPGRWRAQVQAVEGHLSSLTGLHLAVTAPGGFVIHEVRDVLPAGATSCAWEFFQEHLQLALSIEIRADKVQEPVQLAMPISLEIVDS